MAYLAAAICAILTSWFYAAYIRSVDRSEAARAAVADYALLLTGSVNMQLWSVLGDDFRLLLVYDSIAAIATYFTVVRHRHAEARTAEGQVDADLPARVAVDRHYFAEDWRACA